MKQHSRMPHVWYGFEKNARTYMRLVIHMRCSACGETLDWQCTGAPGMPEWRVNQFALMHAHNYPLFQNPMPGRPQPQWSRSR